MPERSKGDVTTLLTRATGGDEDAKAELFGRVEHELRVISSAKIRGARADYAVQTTVLIDDAFMRLVRDEARIDWQNRRQFYRAAARAMRRILIDQERARRAQRRGGGEPPVDVEPDSLGVESPLSDLLALDEALTKLAEFSPRQGKIVELHHFGGYTLEETAGILGISRTTAKADWRIAKAWLHKELSADSK